VRSMIKAAEAGAEAASLTKAAVLAAAAAHRNLPPHHAEATRAEDAYRCANWRPYVGLGRCWGIIGHLHSWRSHYDHLHRLCMATQRGETQRCTCSLGGLGQVSRLQSFAHFAVCAPQPAAAAFEGGPGHLRTRA
jgi:hypothetical protein